MRRRFARSGRMAAILVVLSLTVFVGRAIWANGVFASVTPGFSGSCKAITGIPGVEDIETVNGTVFVAVAGARGPSPQDGIYTLSQAGHLTRLAGAPRDFHPRGIGSFRSPDGKGVFLLAVDRRSSGRFSIDSFEVTNPDTAPALVAQSTIESGLLTDPQDVVATGPGNFYVSNTSAKQAITRRLADYGMMPGSDILYFNGMSFRSVADGLYGARGLLLTPDGNHLLVASLTTRALRSFDRNMFDGTLTEGDSLTLDAAPEKITLDAHGEVWAAGHANLFSWRRFMADPAHRATSQVFRVSLASGVPAAAAQIYANDGGQIAGAGVAAALGTRLLIGSSLDGRLLDCAPQ